MEVNGKRTTISPLVPEHIKADFELALMQNLDLSFPPASFNGCHYTESYSPLAYRLSTRQMAQIFCLVLGSPFIPIRNVRMPWAGLKVDQPQVHGIDEFIAYFEHTWLSGQFASAKWNVYSEEGPRMNTTLEG